MFLNSVLIKKKSPLKVDFLRSIKDFDDIRKEIKVFGEQRGMHNVIP